MSYLSEAGGLGAWSSLFSVAAFFLGGCEKDRGAFLPLEGCG